DQIGRRDRRRADRLHGRLAVTHLPGELPRVQAVRIDARVRAERDLHARLHRLLEVLPLDLVALRLLRGEVGRDADRLALTDVFGVVDVGHEVGAALLHQADSLVVDVGSVLDRGDSGADGVLDALGGVRVRRDAQALVRRLLDRRADLLVGILDRVGVAAVRQEGAGREDLD